MVLEPRCAPCPVASGAKLSLQTMPSLCICPRDTRGVLARAKRVIQGPRSPGPAVQAVGHEGGGSCHL